eukprot:TRINITY_DN6492_c0_g1_i3.p1 TRINITY_DN6492_c0_g1~~TRINITY_DN6492_c0_g1_i3.p1  ORF type:complete len:214 (-),score=29.04 TRINITY_DN6492_c0_g1_i3:420-965(-)
MQSESKRENIYHCSLIGVVADENVDELMWNTLIGVCEPYKDLNSTQSRIREIVFCKKGTEVYTPESELRVRCVLEEQGVPCRKWSLHHYGPAPDREIPAFARPVVEVEVSDQIEMFLEHLGYKYPFLCNIYPFLSLSTAVISFCKYSFRIQTVGTSMSLLQIFIVFTSYQNMVINPSTFTS